MVAPPRSNGELVFAAPWESRLFGLTMALHRAGAFEWEDFRTRIMDEIRSWEACRLPESRWSYYERWQVAFERLLAEKGLCPVSEIEELVTALAARPPGHDHPH